MYLKLFSLFALALSCISCVKHDLLSEKYAMSMGADIIYEKTKENSGDAICSQPGLLACFKETDFKCKYELEKLKQPCYDKSVAKMAKPLDMDGYQEFVTYYMTCLMLNHSLQQGTSAKQGLDCLGKLDFDEEQLMSQMFK
jgi:hypothetical protein